MGELEKEDMWHPSLFPFQIQRKDKLELYLQFQRQCGLDLLWTVAEPIQI